jgi:uncharacterized tannase-like protein DUF6351
MGMRELGRRGGLAAVVVVVLGVAAVACSSGDDGDGGSGGDPEEAAADSGIAVEVVSSRPEYVSGGDAVVAVTVADDAGDPADVEVRVGDRDVTDAFASDAEDERRLVGLVEDLPDGDSTITAQVGGETGEQDVTNHPTTGPLFSGEPFDIAVCTTQVFGLEPSTPEDDCAAPSEVRWRYVDTAGAVKDLADPANVPADADVVEVDGEEVPFVLRDEVGVLNRAVYQITMLEPHPDPADPAQVDTSAWNDRLVYRFGGGCGASFTQGFTWAGDPSLEVLRRGYATATATFNTFQVMCNDVLSAETVSMVKEHFAEAYGEPAFTIGEGGSGGAIQQLLIAQDYPGLLDGIAPSLVFPDALTTGAGVFDCRLLANWYETPEGSQLTGEQQAAVNGHASAGTCGMWDAAFAGNIDVVAGCQFNVGGVFGGGDVPGIPPEEIYDPETNPDGRRCSVWDANVHVTGRDPETGYARSGYDNQGVQYGLDALNAGTITPDQFVALNVGVGGFDQDGQPQAERSVVPEELVARAYETGRVTGPYGGLPDTPILVVSPYLDAAGDIHDRVRAYSVIDRLADDGGVLPGTVSVWLSRGDGGGGPGTLSGALGEGAAEPTFVLDEWLTAAAEQRESEGGSWQDALVAAKPESATSRCETQGGEPIVDPGAYADEACLDAQPPHEEPRMAAGAPRANDVLKCQLVPVEDATDQYEVELSDDQLDQLAEVFPDGVCDWAQPSVGQSEPTDTWLAYPED